MMKSFIQKFVPIRGNEMKPFLFCFFINLLLGITFIFGSAITDALFLKEFGAEYLAPMFTISAVFVIIIFPFYNYFSNKFNPSQIFYLFSAVFSGLLILTNLVLLLVEPPKLIYPFLLIFFAIYSAFFYTHFASYLTAFFDTMQSKRLLSSIFSAFILGTIIGGFLLPILLEFPKGINLLLGLWVLILAIVNILVFKNQKNSTLEAVPEEEEGFFASVKNNFNIVKKSSFIKFTLLAVLINGVLIAGADIISNTIFASHFTETESLIAFYGVLEGGISITALLLQFFVVPSLIRFSGIKALNLVLPILFLFSFAGLAFLPTLIFYFAIFNRFNISASAEYIEPTAQSLLLNALIPKQKTQVLTLSGGFIEPLGPIIAGILLTVLMTVFAIGDLVIIFFFFSIGYFIFAWRQNKLYGQELIQLLQSQNFNLFKAATEGRQNFDPKIINILKENLKKEGDEAIISVEILTDLQGENVLPLFFEIMPKANKSLRLIFLQIFSRLSNEQRLNDSNILKIQEQVIQLLDNSDSEICQHALRVLDKLDLKDQFIEKIFPFLKNSNSVIASFSAIYLLNRESAKDHHIDALNLIKNLLTNQDEKIIRTTLVNLSALKNISFEMINLFFSLLQSVTADKKSLQKEIAKTLQKILEQSNGSLVWQKFFPQIRLLLDHAVREIRLFAFQVLGKHSQLTTEELEKALGDSFKKIRIFACSIASLNLSKEDSLKKIQTWREQTQNLFLWESALILESKLTPQNPDLLKLINDTIFQAGVYLSQLTYLLKYHHNQDQFLLLQTLLRDRFLFSLQTAIDLLENLGDKSILTTVKKSLFSKNKRLRSSALEALENLKIEGINKTVKLLDPLITDLSYQEKFKIFQAIKNLPTASLEKISALINSSKNEWEKMIIKYAERKSQISNSNFQ